MAEVILKDKSIKEPPVSELHPLRTTVQGTQQDGVEFGHEHRDIDAAAIGRWFAILGGIILFTYVSMAWLFSTAVRIDAQNDKLASPMATTREVPPEPYIEGLGLGGKEKAGTHEHLKLTREKEDKTLQQWGLSSAERAKTGRRTAPIPKNVVDEVARQGAAAEPAQEATNQSGPGVSLH